LQDNLARFSLFLEMDEQYAMNLTQAEAAEDVLTKPG
jgi:hypothetical protein